LKYPEGQFAATARERANESEGGDNDKDGGTATASSASGAQDAPAQRRTNAAGTSSPDDARQPFAERSSPEFEGGDSNSSGGSRGEKRSQTARDAGSPAARRASVAGASPLSEHDRRVITFP
jgi:hypothetical protein